MNFNVDDEINKMNRTLTNFKALTRKKREESQPILKSSIDAFPSLCRDHRSVTKVRFDLK